MLVLLALGLDLEMLSALEGNNLLNEGLRLDAKRTEFTAVRTKNTTENSFPFRHHGSGEANKLERRAW